MDIRKNTEKTPVKELIAIFKNLDFNIFFKYLTTYTNEKIQEILVQLNQIIDKDQNRKEDLGTIKTKILNLVGKNRDTLGYINLPANQQKKTLPVHEILNLLKKLMQTGDEKEQQKNNLNQKIQR